MRKSVILSVVLMLWVQPMVMAQQFTLSNGVQQLPLRFDGYTSEQEILAILPGSGSLTIESWIAPLEYSFNISAIVNKQKDFQRGFLLGINHVGQLVGSMAAGGEWQTCLSTATIPLTQWSHVAMVYTQGVGLKLYINGEPCGEQLFSAASDLYPEGTLLLGRTQTKMSPAYTERKTSSMEKTWMRYNGLIGELNLFDKVLSGMEIQKNANKSGLMGQKAIDFPQFPAADIPMGTFGAFYTRLRYTPGWEALWRVGNTSDVIVRFPDKPIKYVFWRGTGYIPAVVTENNIWMTDQSVENFVTGECFETMGDKQCRYSHVRILESTPVRCVIHWRYALTGINHHIYSENDNGWGDWVDEYWTIYPDGVAVRKQVLHSPGFVKSPSGYQFQETIFFNQPGTRPQDNIEMDAIMFCDMDGNVSTYNWIEGPPKKFDKSKYQPIQLVNLKSQYKPFSIFHPERVTKPFSFGWIEGYSTFPCWNHWPVSQIKSDGRNASAPDRPSHSSLAETTGCMQIVDFGPDSTVIARQLIGMTTDNIETLLPLAQSWNNAPELILTDDNTVNKGYDIYQRVYQLEQKRKTNEFIITFSILASEKSPIQNLALEIANRDYAPTQIILNGKTLRPEKDYFTGQISTLDGGKTVIWIYCVSTKNVHLQIN